MFQLDFLITEKTFRLFLQIIINNVGLMQIIFTGI